MQHPVHRSRAPLIHHARDCHCQMQRPCMRLPSCLSYCSGSTQSIPEVQYQFDVPNQYAWMHGMVPFHTRNIEEKPMQSAASVAPIVSTLERRMVPGVETKQDQPSFSGKSTVSISNLVEYYRQRAREPVLLPSAPSAPCAPIQPNQPSQPSQQSQQNQPNRSIVPSVPTHRDHDVDIIFDPDSPPVVSTPPISTLHHSPAHDMETMEGSPDYSTDWIDQEHALETKPPLLSTPPNVEMSNVETPTVPDPIDKTSTLRRITLFLENTVNENFVRFALNSVLSRLQKHDDLVDCKPVPSAGLWHPWDNTRLYLGLQRVMEEFQDDEFSLQHIEADINGYAVLEMFDTTHAARVYQCMVPDESWVSFQTCFANPPFCDEQYTEITDTFMTEQGVIYQCVLEVALAFHDERECVFRVTDHMEIFHEASQHENDCLDYCC